MAAVEVPKAFLAYLPEASAELPASVADYAEGLLVANEVLYRYFSSTVLFFAAALIPLCGKS